MNKSKTTFLTLNNLTLVNSVLNNFINKSVFHNSQVNLWRNPRSKTMFFRKKSKNEERFPTEYTSFTKKKETPFSESVLIDEFKEYRFKYPDFLPVTDLDHRQPLKDAFERKEMLKRRSVLEIPEFYVGSYLAVTVSDPFAVERESKFVGICISRQGQGLKSVFTLRNKIENEGVEICYELYNPSIRSIQVLKLEKRLDDHLLYLRDADLSYSYVPFDYSQKILPKNFEVPINTTLVKLNSNPWSKKWHLHDLKGIQNLDNIVKKYYDKSLKNVYENQKYDLVKDYRENINEEEQMLIWKEVKQGLDEIKKKKNSKND